MITAKNIQMIISASSLFLFLMCFSVPVWCQQKSTTYVSRNTLYADFASKDVYYSINYDHIFHAGDKLKWSYRIGLSVLKNTFSFPLGIQLFTGAGESHAEFSLTVIPYVDHSPKFANTKDGSDKYIYVEPGIGYRYQKPDGGLFFKAVFTPIIFLDPPSDNFWNMDPKLYAGGNIGIGYTFPAKRKS